MSLIFARNSTPSPAVLDLALAEERWKTPTFYVYRTVYYCLFTIFVIFVPSSVLSKSGPTFLAALIAAIFADFACYRLRSGFENKDTWRKYALQEGYIFGSARRRQYALYYAVVHVTALLLFLVLYAFGALQIGSAGLGRAIACFDLSAILFVSIFPGATLLKTMFVEDNPPGAKVYVRKTAITDPYIGGIFVILLIMILWIGIFGIQVIVDSVARASGASNISDVIEKCIVMHFLFFLMTYALSTIGSGFMARHIHEALLAKS